jgi:hypothetical protein
MTKQAINSHDQIDKGDVYISRAYSKSRSPYFTGWKVVGNGFNTDTENGYWNNYGCIQFSSWEDHGDRGKAALERAKAWANENYGERKWKRNSMGDYVDARYDPIPKKS